jgi:hypothetical protein
VTQIWHRPPGERLTAVCDDRPLLAPTAADGDGVRLELTSGEEMWRVELTRDDCERIAERIGYYQPVHFRPVHFRPVADPDS